MIDLHLHTTASDGASAPADLVREAAAAGIRTMAVTDHDTVAAVPEVVAAASPAGLDIIAGVEVTAVHDGRDIHILGYFVDVEDRAFSDFLATQRLDRRRRVLEIAARLQRLAVPVDAAAFEAEAEISGHALGRPRVAAALVEAGHAADIADAFERYLGEGRPAFVARRGPSPAEVIQRIRDAGGTASLAHPGKIGRDELIAPMVDAGLPAIEVFHPDHDEVATTRYTEMARARGLLITGGSDYHGPGSARAWAFGRVSLPADAFAAFAARRRPA